MEDLGFFPYPSMSFGSPFDDVIMDPGPTSFFLKESSGEDILLGQGLDQLQTKLGLDLFKEENNGSPINVDDDWLMKDLSDDIKDPIDIPYTLDDLKSHGYFLIDGVLHDPNFNEEEYYYTNDSAFMNKTKSSTEGHHVIKRQDAGFKCLVCNIALFRLKEVMNHVLSLHCSKGNYQCTLCNTQLHTCGSVKKHIKNVHFGFNPFTCPMCKKSIQQKSHLKTHIEKQHGGKKSLFKKALANHQKLKAQMTNNKKVMTKDDSLTCPLCHKVYLSIETKEKHLLTFHKQSLAKSDQIQHRRRSHSGPDVTEIKSQSVKPKTHLALNMQKNHGKTTTASVTATASTTTVPSKHQRIECPVCHTKLPDVEAKKEHLKTVHHNLKTFECMDCQQVVYSRLHLKAHKHVYHTMPQNLPTSALQCEYHNCKQEFRTLKQVLNHVENQHAYQCPECPRHLQTTGGLAKHYKKAHISNELVCCNYCGNCYKDNYELDNHIREKHSHDSTTESSDMEQPTADQRSLLVEKIMHPGVLESIKKSVSKLAAHNKGEKLPCEYCRANELFDTEHDVLEHVKNMHPIQCPQCPLKMFKYPTSVRKHFKKFHGDETPYFCKTCTLVFTDQEAVQYHMDNEHGIPNVVVVTNIVTQTQSSSNSPPPTAVYKAGITCIVCGETNFESSAALAEHRSETHMYKCPDCDKEYKLTDSLRKHVRLVHNENVTMTCCKFCDKVFYDTSLKAGHVSTFHSDCTSGGSGNSTNTNLQNNDTTASENMTMMPQKNITASMSKSTPSANSSSSSNNTKYHCPQCTQSFYMVDGLRKHARMSHNLSIMSCPDCTKVFTDMNSRNIHMSKGHSNNHNHQNNMVNGGHSGSLLKNLTGTPATKSSLLKSETSSTMMMASTSSPVTSNAEESVYQCPKCSKGYSIAKSLRKHCRINHNKLSICFCHNCPKVFVNSAQRDSHQEKDHCSPQQPHGRNTSSGATELSPPTTTLTTTVNKPTISVNLATTSASGSTISGGNNIVSNNPHRIIVVKSPTKSPPNMHNTTTILKKVEVIQPQKCYKCNDFVSPGYHHKCDLIQYQPPPQQAGQQQSTWNCPHCINEIKTFKLLSSLRKHCREVHSGFKGQVVICEPCTLAFKDLRGLEIHNREKHSSIPSSPESFHGFATPTKELEMSKTMETVILNLHDLI